MSLKSLPLLFINLGGEMMYILDQRLRAQEIVQEKALKVQLDIVGTMFNKRFIDQLFRPQSLYSKRSMRAVFDRLAHVSIMRLNSGSMDKLYDLMTMAIKYQISLCLRPRDILLITLNHLDAIRDYITVSSSIKQQVEYVYKVLLEKYAILTDDEFQLIRQTLLCFFQDMHIRVSILLKDGFQNNNGRFKLPLSGQLPYGTELPGTVRLYHENGTHTEKKFSISADLFDSKREGSFGMTGDRITLLGTNMYSPARPMESIAQDGKESPPPTSDVEPAQPDPLGRAQLDLLFHLIGGRSSQSEFHLDLFTDDKEEENTAYIQPAPEAEQHVLKIDASQKHKSRELDKIIGEMSVDDGGGQGGGDLLDLMDSAQ